MSRLRFKKDGKAVYVSHLDLMRIMRRSLLRAGLPVAHSEGYNPHANITIALPLPLGHSSTCELMDFEPLETYSPDETLRRLNESFPDGITAVNVYDTGRPIREIEYLRHSIEFIYDREVPTQAADELTALMNGEGLTVFKKTKKSEGDFDISPCIKSASFSISDSGSIICTAVLTAARPMLNPTYLTQAVTKYIPQYTPDFVRYKRIEVLDSQMQRFE